MANRLKMAKVHSIGTLHERGWSNRRIARALGIHRETVARYVGLAGQEEPEPAEAPTDPVQAKPYRASGLSNPGVVGMRIPVGSMTARGKTAPASFPVVGCLHV